MFNQFIVVGKIKDIDYNVKSLTISTYKNHIINDIVISFKDLFIFDSFDVGNIVFIKGKITPSDCVRSLVMLSAESVIILNTSEFKEG